VSTERIRTLYGAADGTWLLVETSLDVVPPPTIAVGIPGASPFPGRIVELRCLGPLHDVFTTIRAAVDAIPTVGLRGRTGKMPAQEALGRMFGVSQQSISRYLAGTSEPYLPNGLWRLLVRVYHDPSLALTAIHGVHELISPRNDVRRSRSVPTSKTV
jgi:hypothetical protein